MAFLIGIGLIALGRYLRRQERIPDDAISVFGSVIGVESRRSSLNRRRTLYGPVIAYDHPVNGRRQELQPRSFHPRQPEIGETIEVSFSPTMGRTYRAPEYRWGHLVLPGLGVVMILLQIADWVF